jgi:hypothetical protein
MEKNSFSYLSGNELILRIYKRLNFFFKFSRILFIYLYVHTLFGSLLHPAPLNHPLGLYSPQFQAGPVLPLSLILLEKRHKHTKEDKAFLLVELRIAKQRRLKN